MSQGDPRSLSDGDIVDYLHANTDFFRRALDVSNELVAKTDSADPADEAAVPVESLRVMRQALLALSKGTSHTLMAESATFNEAEMLCAGDTGANCDYNPFRGINF